MFGAFVFYMHDSRFLIATVTVSGNKVVDTEDVESHVNAYLQGSYFYIIPHNNSFFYPKEKIVADLTASFPQFKNIAVYRADMNTLLVSVTELRGYALWCGTDSATLDMSAPCYFTDDTGKIISTAPSYSGNVYPRFFGSSVISSGVNPLGQSFISADTFQQLLTFEKTVDTLGFSVKAIVIGDNGENSFVLDLGQGKTALIRFMSDADYATLAGNLSLVLAKNEIAALLKTDKAHLQYFDLRFDNKVYYKFSDK